MTIETLRDLVLIIFGIVSSTVLIILAIMSYSLYRQVKEMAKSMTKTLAVIEAISSTGGEIHRTFTQVSNLMPIIREKFGSLIKAFTGTKDGEE